MGNTYNIYRMDASALPALTEKARAVGLIEQLTRISSGYTMTFYFSERVEGAEVWWGDVYREFFRDGVAAPRNTFNYGLLVARRDEGGKAYIVSLGKAHFYLSSFVERDFGINVAVRMARESSTLLKKSRYFTGIKSHEISSYSNYTPNNYEAGESVEHLKAKPLDPDIWGDGNIVFSCSIQMRSEKGPEELVQIFENIESALSGEPVIALPKLEDVKEEDVIERLNQSLDDAVRTATASVAIGEMEVIGVQFCFRFHDLNYQLFSYGENRAIRCRRNIEGDLTIEVLRDYLNEHDCISSLDEVGIKFSVEGQAGFRRKIKELIDFHVDGDGVSYFLSEGQWRAFNQPFMDYLAASLGAIDHSPCDDLCEADYLTWKAAKEALIASAGYIGDKIVYREYYFNEQQAARHGYEVLDRKLVPVESMVTGKKSYKVEVADLYRDREVISVKISDDAGSLVYNIQQSMTSLELYCSGVLDIKREIDAFALWFVFPERVSRITEYNSVQFLLAVEQWRKKVISLGKLPKIYISYHDRA